MSPAAFETFYFHSTSFDPVTLQAHFRYSFDRNVYFEERIDFSAKDFTPESNIDTEIIENLLFHLSLALGISYYKLSPTKKLVIEHGILDEYQQSFWKKFYLQGLWEFLYKNQISPEGLFEFISMGKKKYRKIPFSRSADHYLVPIWWGKDSIVSMELLKKEGKSYDLFSFGKNYILHSAVAQVSGLHHMVIERHMDPILFKMNQEGYYNGHIPITGIIAFVLQVVNYLYGYQYDVLSNEKSADIENLTWQGFSINHQYSKSREFEEDFGGYVAKYMSDTIYFSRLRNLYEISIAKLFSEMKPYFPVFSSCNNNFKIIEQNKTTANRWCLKCPKCAFVFSILHPFTSSDDRGIIFGHDLYEDESLLPLFQELLGYSGHKPFECVGTNEEVTFAMYLSVERYQQEGKTLPFILSFFKETILPTLSEEKIVEFHDKFHI